MHDIGMGGMSPDARYWNGWDVTGYTVLEWVGRRRMHNDGMGYHMQSQIVFAVFIFPIIRILDYIIAGFLQIFMAVD
jgi:hypothetical protein